MGELNTLPQGASHTAYVTIVGMRFYPGACAALQKESRLQDQCLYLVADVKNDYDANAVMLHNGKQKLGSVTAEEALKVRKLLDAWRAKDGKDHVISVRLEYISDLAFFERKASIMMVPKFHIRERLARKFADQQHAEGQRRK